MLLLMAYISITAVTAAGGFALTASPFCKRPKGTKTLRPSVRPLAWARRSFAPAFIWGHRLRSASLRPPLDVCGFAARRYAPTPQMNASTQPPEGAGRSRSKAGELTLGLMSGEKRSVYTEPLVGARLAREGGLTADKSLADVHRSTVGARLAREGGLTADQFLADVHRSAVGARLAREGGLPADQFLADVHRSTVGARLASEGDLPADQFLADVHRSTVGARLAREGGLTADQSLADVHRSTVGARLAREGRLPADQFLADVHRSTVGVSLLAIAVCQPTIFSLLPPIDRSLRSAWECRPGRSAFHFCVLKDV